MSKVSVVKAPCSFRKITLTIEIESEVEHTALKGLFGCDYTVPDCVRKGGYIGSNEHAALRTIFTHAYTQL